ncbi:hypothetical protein WG66_001035 [Moniliophthora roreri]|nr:hypothetical protein WG66_001035 [Moniliophthora roreri]
MVGLGVMPDHHTNVFQTHGGEDCHEETCHESAGKSIPNSMEFHTVIIWKPKKVVNGEGMVVKVTRPYDSRLWEISS